MNLKNQLFKFDNLIANYSSKSIYNYYLGLSRSLLAIGTLLTLLFTNEKIMFKSGIHTIWNDQIVPINQYNIFDIVPTSHITLTKWIICLILIIIATGWRPRITCIFHWYISACFLNSALDIEGGDQITSNVTLLLIPILLMDNRKWHWDNNIVKKNITLSKIKGIISNTIFNLIKLQVCVIYLHSAVGKLNVTQWLNGTAPYYWFNHPVFGMSNWLKPLINPFLTNNYTAFFIAWGIMTFELILASSILIEKKYYKLLFTFAIFFHLLIILIHGLFSFFFAMASVLCIYFLIDYYNYKLKLYEKK